jgi:amidophosphoribosyltransferase
MISDVFSEEVIDGFKNKSGSSWLFQTRYGTNGAGSFENVQPIIRVHECSGETFAMVHNGQFSNEELFCGEDSDSVRFANELAHANGNNWNERILGMHNKSEGAWSVCIATSEGMFLFRDKYGIRPLSFGMKMDRNDNLVWVAASETAALEVMGVSTYREVTPGSVIKLDANGMNIIQEADTNICQKAACVFENIYLENGNSAIHAIREDAYEIKKAISVTQFRKSCGTILAQEETLDMPHQVDFAIGIPGTGIAGGRTYAERVGVPYIQAITDRRPAEVDARTFMTPDIQQIPNKIRDHFYFEKNFLTGMSVVLIDDSMVRGNITKGIIRLLKEEYSVTSVHIRILCPPIDKPCYLGINTRSPEELIAYRNGNDVEQIREEIGADTLQFLSDTGLVKATETENGFCLGCMAHHQPPVGPNANLQ